VASALASNSPMLSLSQSKLTGVNASVANTLIVLGTPMRPAVCAPPPGVPPSPNGCPTTIGIASGPVVFPLDNGSKAAPTRTFPYLHTGIGEVDFLVVGPGPLSFNGNQIFESISNISQSSCKGQIKTSCTADTAPFIVGEEPDGPRYGTTFTLPFGGLNTFWDLHTIEEPGDLLTAAGQNATGCQTQCLQTFSCNGVPLGSFNVLRKYSHGIIDGVSVTNVNVTYTQVQ
jgi:hypothetical protein